MVQLLLSYNTCRGIQLLRPNNCSWLLHLPGTIALAGSKSRGRILLTGETLFRRCYKPNHTFDTCWGIFESFTATVTKSEKSLLVSISNEKVKMQYFFVMKSEKLLLFHIEKWQIITNTWSKINPSLLLTEEAPFYLSGKKNYPRPNPKLLLSALIKA